MWAYVSKVRALYTPGNCIISSGTPMLQKQKFGRTWERRDRLYGFFSPRFADNNPSSNSSSWRLQSTQSQYVTVSSRSGVDVDARRLETPHAPYSISTIYNTQLNGYICSLIFIRPVTPPPTSSVCPSFWRLATEIYVWFCKWTIPGRRCLSLFKLFVPFVNS